MAKKMAARKPMLRLLTLGSCVELATAFGTFARVGVAPEEAGGGGGSCPCETYSQCNVVGPESLSNGAGSFNTYALVSWVNSCWDQCYKNPELMVDGSQSYNWPACETLSQTYINQMCDENNGDPSFYGRITNATIADSNPFLDSKGGINTTVYKVDICSSAVDDIAPVETRCNHITAPGSIQFFEKSCNKAMNKVLSSDSSADAETTCNSLYKYNPFSPRATRAAYMCVYDRDTNKCGWDTDYPGGFPAPASECQELLCTGDDATDPANPSCTRCTEGSNPDDNSVPCFE